MRTILPKTFDSRVNELATSQASQVPLEMHGMGGGMGMMMWLMMIIFWILILLALGGGVYWMYSQLFGASSGGSSGRITGNPTGEDAVDILAARYARGEIDEEEYTKRKRQITEEDKQ